MGRHQRGHRHPRRRRYGPVLLLLVLVLAGAVGLARFSGWLPPNLSSSVPARRVSWLYRPLSLPLPQSAGPIQVRPIRQLPQLLNGCEVTSLAMLLEAARHPVSKMVLAALAPRDPTPWVLRSPTYTGNPIMDVASWGNPNVGFVGSISGYGGALGYAIYHKPLARLLDEILPQGARDLTGDDFTTVEQYVAEGVPVEVWTTLHFHPTHQWVTWSTPEGPIRATPWEHAVLVVGYTPTDILINNPYNGEAGEAVSRGPFLQAWRQLGRQAVTVNPDLVLPRGGWVPLDWSWLANA